MPVDLADLNAFVAVARARGFRDAGTFRDTSSGVTKEERERNAALDVLGLDGAADQAEIKAAFRDLAKKHKSNATDTGTNDNEYTLFSGEYRTRYADGTQLVVNLGANRSEWDYWLPRSIFALSADPCGRKFSTSSNSVTNVSSSVCRM